VLSERPGRRSAKQKDTALQDLTYLKWSPALQKNLGTKVNTRPRPRIPPPPGSAFFFRGRADCSASAGWTSLTQPMSNHVRRFQWANAHGQWGPFAPTSKQRRARDVGRPSPTSGMPRFQIFAVARPARPGHLGNYCSRDYPRRRKAPVREPQVANNTHRPKKRASRRLLFFVANCLLAAGPRFI